MRWSVPQDEGEINIQKLPLLSNKSRRLEIEIRFFLEANFVGGEFRLNSPKRKSFMGLCRELYSAIVAVETFDFHPFARFEYQHIRYEIVEQSRNKQGGKITIDNVPAEYLLENE